MPRSRRRAAHGYETGHAGGEGDPLIALTAMWDITGFPVAALPAGVGAAAACRSGCR